VNTENRNMPATSGEVFWRDPDDEPPPRGTKLLLLTTGGITVTGDWRDDSNYKAWSPMPKQRRKE
jgi:hypothetical protein